MKVLWFEVTPPGTYSGNALVIGGWQDSLERVVRSIPEIELSIAFESQGQDTVPKKVDNVTYYPIVVKYTKSEKKQAMESWNVQAEKLIPAMREIVEQVNPDLIHVFGTEWPFGLISEITEIPVVIHIQGAIAPYNNAMFPPSYNLWDVFRNIGWTHFSRLKKAWKAYKYDCSRLDIEMRTWKSASHYMGRTHWDKALSAVMHPNRHYYHVEEALRDSFTSPKKFWVTPAGNKIHLISTGCSNFWKGPDMLLKTARIMSDLGVDFEWKVAGMMSEDIKSMVERREGGKFKDYNVNFIGFTQPDKLSEELCNSTIYVHTAYVENSPNSICEAQCLGVPIVSTNVGGISTLVKDGEQGILVPANDPWQMAYAIVQLAADKTLMKKFSDSSKAIARVRHSDKNIAEQLLSTYNSILKKDNV